MARDEERKRDEKSIFVVRWNSPAFGKVTFTKGSKGFCKGVIEALPEVIRGQFETYQVGGR
jgi:hypothetical protein